MIKPYEPLKIGTKNQLLMDNYIVADMWRLKRVQHNPVKCPKNPVIIKEYEWEAGGVSHPCIIYEPEKDLFRMWYNGMTKEGYYYDERLYRNIETKPEIPPYMSICYAESKDGINWIKPELGFVKFKGKNTNQININGELGNMFIDARETDPAKKYKMFRYGQNGSPQNGTPVMSYSADGFNWIEEQIQTNGIFSDTANNIVYDDVNKRWLLYQRTNTNAFSDFDLKQDYRKLDLARTNGRLAVSISYDLVSWTHPEVIFFPDEHDWPDIDRLNVFKYEGMYIGLGLFLDDTTQYSMHGVMKLLYSRDGLNWERLHDREDFIPRGPAGSCDSSMALTGPNDVIRYANQLYVYYTGVQDHEEEYNWESSICLGRMRRDGFVEVKADDLYETGYLLTKPFVLEGNVLQINAKPYARHQGRINEMRVELLEHNGDIIAGHSFDDCGGFVTDFEDYLVSWNGNPDIGHLRGRVVRVRFLMRKMGLFSFRVNDLQL